MIKSKVISLFLLPALLCYLMVPLMAGAYSATITVHSEILPLTLDYGTIGIYGTPEDVQRIDNIYHELAEPQEQRWNDDTSKMEWRYLGYFKPSEFASAEPFTNPDFPIDPGGDPTDRPTRDFVKNPWRTKHPKTGNYLCSENNTEFVAALKKVWDPYIKDQLKAYNLPDFMTDVSALDTCWKIQSYPLNGELYGSLREWHWRNGYPYYETFRVNFYIAEAATLEIEPPTATKKVGETQQYNATFKIGNSLSFDVTKDPNTTWTINNTSIAAINNSTNKGLATGKSPGTATITVQYNDSVYGLKEATATIKVVQDEEPTGTTNPTQPTTPTSSYNLSVTGLEVRNGAGYLVSDAEVNKQYKVIISKK